MTSRRDGGGAGPRDPRWKLAALYERLGRLDEHVKVTAQLLRARPSDVKARCNLGRTLMRQARFDEAETVLSGGPAEAANWELRLLRARLSVHRQDLAGGVEGYRAAAALKPDQMEVYFYLAEALMRLERTAEMDPFLRRAMSACPEPEDGDLKGWLERFRLAFLLRDFKEAFRIGDLVLDRTRRAEFVETLRWPTIIEEYDFTCASDDYHRLALAELGRLADAEPRRPWAHYYRLILSRAVAARRLSGGEDAGLRDDERRVERLAGKRYGWMLMESAKKRLYAGEFPAAVRLLKAVVDATDPPNWLAQCMVGEALVCRGLTAEAFAAFEAAERIAPEFERGNVLAWKGEMLLWLGDYPRAMDALDEALTRSSQYAHCWKGGALVAAGRPLEALPVLARAVSISPWDLEAKAWTGEALHRLGRHREALEQLALPPGAAESPNPYWHVLRGLIRRALGDARGLREESALVSRFFSNAPPVALKKLGLSAAGSDDELAAALENILARSRGLRRGSFHERSAWMR
jgi:tetratricopeptide (TPR) repeat protein